ncbi:MAG: D-amino acid aminotransferase, partial [Thermoleophilia bacterium]
DEVVTAPADGLLPGVARAICQPAVGARERAAEEREWRAAREIVAVNALRGAVAIAAVDGAPVGDGAPGPLARALAVALAAAAAG